MRTRCCHIWSSQCLLLLLATGVVVNAAPPDIPSVRYDNPIAGFSIQIPDDWEMAAGTANIMSIGIDAEVGGGSCLVQPVLWFFRSKGSVDETVEGLVEWLKAIGANPISPGKTGIDGEVEMFTQTRRFGAGTLEHWLIRRENGQTYAIAAMVKKEFQDQFQSAVDTALATCYLIDQPALERFLEPTELAYRMLLPKGWKWTGKIIRGPGLPGWFEYRVHNPDMTVGAFSAPPGMFGINTPYVPAAECARTYILPALRQQLGGVELERVRQLPRVGAHFLHCAGLVGLTSNPRIDKVRADYLTTRNGQQIRIRVSVATIMLSSSALVSHILRAPNPAAGRGNWQMMSSGAWAPVDTFERDYPLGRGALANLMSDDAWMDYQNVTALEAIVGFQEPIDDQDRAKMNLDDQGKDWHKTKGGAGTARRKAASKFVSQFLGFEEPDPDDPRDPDGNRPTPRG